MSGARRRWQPVLGPYGLVAWGGVLVAATIAETVLVVQRTDDWRTSWAGAVLWHAGSAKLVAPVLAAAAAAVASEVRRSALASVAVAAGRERALLGRIAVQCAGAGLLVHLTGLVAVVLIARAHGLDGAPPLLAALPGVVTIGAWAAAGALIGWRVRSIAAAPLAAVLAFVVLVLVSYGLPTATAEVAGGPDGVALQTDPGWIAAATAFSALLVVVVLALGRRPAGSSRRTSRVVGIVAAVLMVIAVLAGPEDPLREDHRSLVCVGARPSVCVYPERASAALATRARLVSYSTTLEHLVPGAFDGLDRWAEGWEPPSRRVGALTLAESDDVLRLTQDVVAAAGRCGAAEVDGVLQLWITRRSKPTSKLSAADVGYDVPASLLDGPRLDREARRAARALRGRCR